MDRFYKYTQQSIWNSELQCVWKLLDWRSQVVNVIWSSDNIVKIICWLPLFGNNQSVWTMKEMFVKRTYCIKNHAVSETFKLAGIQSYSSTSEADEKEDF